MIQNTILVYSLHEALQDNISLFIRLLLNTAAFTDTSGTVLSQDAAAVQTCNAPKQTTAVVQRQTYKTIKNIAEVRRKEEERSKQIEKNDSILRMQKTGREGWRRQSQW